MSAAECSSRYGKCQPDLSNLIEISVSCIVTPQIQSLSIPVQGNELQEIAADKIYLFQARTPGPSISIALRGIIIYRMFMIGFSKFYSRKYAVMRLCI